MTDKFDKQFEELGYLRDIGRSTSLRYTKFTNQYTEKYIHFRKEVNGKWSCEVGEFYTPSQTTFTGTFDEDEAVLIRAVLRELNKGEKE